MAVRLPDPPRTGNLALDNWCAQMKRVIEQEFTLLERLPLMHAYSGTATSGSTKLPNAALPARWIYVVGSATSGPAWNDGTAWRWPGTGAVVVG
jgi:hypothetical protein